MSTILYIDGENLKHYLKSVLKNFGVKSEDTNLENFDYASLFNLTLKGNKISEIRYTG